MLNATHEELLRRAKELGLPTQHHIDGKDEAGDGASFAVISPRDGQSLVRVADAREQRSISPSRRRAAPSTQGRGRTWRPPSAAGFCCGSLNCWKSGARNWH